MMEMRPLNYRDVRYVVERIRDEDLHEINATRWQDTLVSLVDAVLHHWSTVGWVAVNDGVPVAVIGAAETWPRNWSGWMFATAEFPKIRVALTRFVLKVMMPTLLKRGAIRCDARSIADHKGAHAWLVALGAVKEATLEKYGKAGEDFYVFRWLATGGKHVRQQA